MASTCRAVALVRPSADSLGLMVVSQDRLLEADGDLADYIQGQSYLMSAFGHLRSVVSLVGEPWHLTSRLSNSIGLVLTGFLD